MGLGPLPLRQYFVLSTLSVRMSPRRQVNRFILEDNFRSLHRDYINRSLLGYVAVFNLLPDWVSDDAEIGGGASVKKIQSNLVALLKSSLEMS